MPIPKKNYRYCLSLCAICMICLQIPPANAQKYDVYVDKNYSGDGEDGSSDKPFKTISDAIKKSAGNSSIYIKNGEYKENISLGSGAKLYGEDKKKTILKGSSGTIITAADNNTIHNLTVSGGSTGILANGKIEITDCILKNSSQKAIDLSPISKKSFIKNNTLTNNRKGIYAQKTRELEIHGNIIDNNLEEGLDIREKTSGSIKNNTITNNREGGIEFIVGSSDLLISQNQIKKNKASGLAAQFYTQAKKTGQVRITGNTVSDNGQYGITCKAPSGGNSPKSYWNDSLELVENTLEENKAGSIAKACRIIEVISSDEAQKNATTEPVNPILQEEKPDEDKKDEEALPEDIDQERQQQIISAQQAASEIKNKLDLTISELQGKSKWKIFFIGQDKQEIRGIENNLQLLQAQMQSLEDLTKDNHSENNIESQKMLQSLRDTSKNYSVILETNKNSFSLFGWFLRYF